MKKLRILLSILTLLIFTVKVNCMFTKFETHDPDISYRIIAENEHAFALLTQTPIVPGHTLICPKKVVQFSKDVTPEVWKSILALKDIICTKLEKAVGATGFNFAWNEGSVAGQSVPHFHLHVVPRYEGDTGITQYEPRVFLYRPGGRKQSPDEELGDFAKKLRDMQ